MITSTRNRRVHGATRLRKRGLREDDRRFLVEGARGVAEALAAGVVETVFHVAGSTGGVPAVIAAAGDARVEVLEVSPAVMGHLTSAVTPQGIVAVARFVDVGLDALPVDGLVPVLCSVRDPGNAGTILRSADAAGAAGVVFARDSVDVYNPKAVRASAGSLFHLPVVRDVPPAEAVERLRGRGARVYAASADGEIPMQAADLAGPTALLFGNEAWGIPSEVRDLADATVRVPIHGAAESLNLAAAAALLMFEAARQRSDGAVDLGAVVAASAHDARLPLTALKGFASTLVDRWEAFEDDVRREMVQGMVLDVERVSSMVTLLVDLARIEQGRFDPGAGARDVGESIRAVQELFARSRDYPDVVPKGGGTARLDRDRIEAVLLALCDGAMWWGQDGPIEIEARPDGTDVVIRVHRAGEGPTEEDLPGIFAGPAARGGKIGLYLAQRVVEAAGGSLRASAGNGVTFELRLRA
ncbi:MAG TPA: TrmH family RNA methyltransferase [Actinomycetota bacterium]|nr:TrmH family RNA methyltransferase [Actinomycetota bacterium]